MGPEYSWLEGGSYYQGLVPGPVGPPADIGEVTDIISSAAASSVADAPNAPQITPGAPYQQPGTENPDSDPQVELSTMTAAPGPNTIAASAGNYVQENTAPADSPEIDASTAAAGAAGKNPMGLGGTWSGNYQQPM
ncbi:MAG: hypothetical protein WA197_18455 [Candidatus Acidiferrales bacterium]